MQGFTDDCVIGSCNAKDAEQGFQSAASLRGSLAPADQVVEGGDGVGGEVTFGGTGFDGFPDGGACIHMRLAVEQHVENDVDIDKNFEH